MQITLIETKRLARRADPQTSHEAAARVHEFKAGHHIKILTALRRLGQAGAEQVASLAGIDSYAARKRLPELERLGYVRVVDGATRKTSTGRHERVWVAV
jgi:predicted ArsR family transcriptional regulator